jgi:hypothetical protein
MKVTQFHIQLEDSYYFFFYCYDGVRPCLCGSAASNGPIVHPLDDTWVNMEQRWNDTDKENRMTRKKNLSQCHTVYRKSHMDWPGSETGPPR